ncbi:MAG: hypothetical protein RIM84_11325 [Alphaproteobacteria bacterium]
MIGLLKLVVAAAAIMGAVQGVRSLIQRGRAAPPAKTGTDAVEMNECAVCGIYAGAPCDKPECPLA